jgi:sugar porter (SP) family MFS transporter
MSNVDSQPTFLGARGKKLKLFILVLVVAPSFILFGYNNGSTGGLFGLPSFNKQFPAINTVTTTGAALSQASRIKGVVTGCYDLGAVVGSLSSITYGPQIGRLRTALLGLIVSIVALAIEASSFSLAQLIVGRLLVGFSIGLISAAVPVWQAECSNAEHRGTFVIFEGICISGGITLSEWVDFGLSFTTTKSGQWRGPLVFPALFSIFAIAFVLFMPESPRWLTSKGRIDHAREALSALMDLPMGSLEIEAEIDNIQLSLERAALGPNASSFFRLFRNGKERLLHRTLLAMCGQLFQQMCGIAALVFYTSTFFADLGFDSLHSRIIGCCLTTFQTLCSIIPLFTIDRFGRRKLLIFSLMGMGTSMAVIAGAGSSDKHSAVVAAVVFCFVYDFFYPIGCLGLTFLYATEIAPLAYRIPITALANATQWMGQFIVAEVTPLGTANLKNRYWIIYAVLNFTFALITYVFFPETNGRSLEDMDLIFENTKNIFQTVRIAHEMKGKSGLQLYNEKSAVMGSEEHVEATSGSERHVEADSV